MSDKNHNYKGMDSYAVLEGVIPEDEYYDLHEDEEPDGYECMSCGDIQGVSNGFGCNRCAGPLQDWYS